MDQETNFFRKNGPEWKPPLWLIILGFLFVGGIVLATILSSKPL